VAGARPHQVAECPALALKVATYNVNGIARRLPRLLEWLRQASPDIVCLQEIKTTDEKCPARVLEEAGYGSLWHGQRSHHGVAILAKGERPVEVRRGLPGDDADRQARYLEAEVKGLVVASVYLPNGNPQPGPKFDYKLAWFERFNAHAHALRHSRKPVVLAGDLNVVPTKADIYNEWLWRLDAVVQPETRAAFRRLLEQGWIDATRHFHPEERVYTFWVNDAAFRRNAGFRMDFLMLTPSLAAQLSDTGVDSAERAKDRASDHAPVWVRLRTDAP
jgi:exodeoxyribonuclease-3